ncbi:hypothetical protein [Bacillus sp. MRMR6]|uniref:hypothetical protein n=1 Tax=Bacillus sp. MRMR6 TaxID=1928617 RepID=UPI0020C98DF2|nr:hypothetical protein [Bacillus sp. MRMR6]
MNIKLQTKRLKLVPCTDESLLVYSTKEYELGPHIGMYLDNQKEDSSVLGLIK